MRSTTFAVDPLSPLLPPELDRLLSAPPREREHAWQAFLAEYSRLLLHVARSVCPDRDEMMDAYTFVLDELRAKDASRLRAFVPDGRSKFSTWLVVVARRLCLDFRRQRDGRVRTAQSDASMQELQFRRRLGALAGENVELTEFASSLIAADDRLTHAELHDALVAAVDALAPADRLLLKLRFEDDLPARQIAQMLHLPSPFHVYRRIDAVTRTIRGVLAARGLRESAP